MNNTRLDDKVEEKVGWAGGGFRSVADRHENKRLLAVLATFDAGRPGALPREGAAMGRCAGIG